MRVLLVCLVALCTVPALLAEGYVMNNGNDLLTRCEALERFDTPSFQLPDAENMVRCFDYLQGLHDGIQTTQVAARRLNARGLRPAGALTAHAKSSSPSAYVPVQRPLYHERCASKTRAVRCRQPAVRHS